MKQHYINKVMRKLKIPANRKKEIARDIEEAFSSALEHGETVQQVIERLGSPEEFAANINGQELSKTPKKIRIGIMASAAISILSFIAYCFTRSQRIPASAIGQADAMTTIQITSNLSLNLSDVFLLVGVASLVLTIIIFVKAQISNRR